jgi:hypothetical protein
VEQMLFGVPHCACTPCTHRGTDVALPTPAACSTAIPRTAPSMMVDLPCLPPACALPLMASWPWVCRCARHCRHRPGRAPGGRPRLRGAPAGAAAAVHGRRCAPRCSCCCCALREPLSAPRGSLPPDMQARQARALAAWCQAGFTATPTCLCPCVTCPPCPRTPPAAPGVGCQPSPASLRCCLVAATLQEARKRCFFFDSQGLVVASRNATGLAHHKQPFAHDMCALKLTKAPAYLHSCHGPCLPSVAAQARCDHAAGGGAGGQAHSHHRCAQPAPAQPIHSMVCLRREECPGTCLGLHSSHNRVM